LRFEEEVGDFLSETVLVDSGSRVGGRSSDVVFEVEGGEGRGFGFVGEFGGGEGFEEGRG